MKKEKNLKITPYLYLVPSILIFAVFLFYPFVKTVYLSLFMTNKMGQAKIFVGLQNYIDLLSSESFRNSLKVTLVFVVIVVLGGMLLGLIAAVLCNKAFPPRIQYRLRASDGDRIKLGSHDFPDHAPSGSRNCK